MKNTRFMAVAALILIAALSRFFLIFPNVTAVGAMALFGGAYVSNRVLAFILPLISLFLSDLVLNNVVYAAFNDGKFVWFYDGAIWVYGAVALTVLVGMTISKKVNSRTVLVASIACSLIFFLMSNIGAWQSPIMKYAQNLTGLLTCYTAALPFLLNSLIGDLSFAALLFGGFEFAQKRFTALKLA
jgi:hypothetical protein